MVRKLVLSSIGFEDGEPLHHGAVAKLVIEMCSPWHRPSRDDWEGRQTRIHTQAVQAAHQNLPENDMDDYLRWRLRHGVGKERSVQMTWWNATQWRTARDFVRQAATLGLTTLIYYTAE